VSNHHASAWDRLTEAAIAYADADSELSRDPQWLRARDRLRKAALAYYVACRGTSGGYRAIRRRVVARGVVNQLGFWPHSLL
jgi:hypothetical protein